MKNAHLILLIFTSVFFSCSSEKEGDWDDNIELTQKEFQFSSSENSVVIKTIKDGWWINTVSFNGETDYEQTENSDGRFLISGDEFMVERIGSKEIYVEMNANTSSSERTLKIDLQNGNYFDSISIIQSAK